MVPSSPKPRRVAWVAALATLAIFGALVLAITLQVREQLRQEVLRREAEAMHAVALLQMDNAERRWTDYGTGDPMPEFFVFDAVLESSQLRGVIAVQLFDPSGTLRNALPAASAEPGGARWWPAMLGKPVVRFVPEARAEEVSPVVAQKLGPGTRLPLLDIAVPLQTTGATTPVGVARYWTSAENVLAEFARLDRALALQAGTALLGGALLISLVLAWAFSQLARAQRRLVEQSADLARANEELDFAAKTGALGAISAHLIHGLKNPLAGLEGFVAESAANGGDRGRGEALRTAVETTRRLRGLVNEVVTVLRDEAAGDGAYPVPLSEVLEAARARAMAAAGEAGVELDAKAESEATLTARVANLAGLVLANLLANSIEATPRRGRVSVLARPNGSRVEFVVSDTGRGLSPGMAGTLFRPMKSAKPGGGGMGLAISHRLARHAGGELELLRSDAAGTSFRLTVPAAPERKQTVNP